MLHSLLFIVMQAGIDAGPAQVSCDASTITLWARPTNPPQNYSVSWDGASGPGVFRVVNPTQTTTYRAVLTDLDTSETYEDTTRVLVHPGNPDLDNSGGLDGGDWLLFYSRWGQPPVGDDDPDGDGAVSVLDWFYFCNFDVAPPNTPPVLSVSAGFTVSGDTLVIDYQLDDMENEPTLHLSSQPENGFATLISGVLRYSPDLAFVGTDQFTVYASDGYVVTPDVTVNIEVLAPDTYGDLYDAIFWPYCRACHLEGVSSGGLNLDTYENAQAGGNNGPAFVSGQPGVSPLYQRTVDGSMPLGSDPLSTVEVERIRLWILKGAIP